jgi:hypothetical protein
MKHPRLAAALALAALSFGACKGSEHSAATPALATEDVPAEGRASGELANDQDGQYAMKNDPVPAPTDDRKIVRTGNIDIVVEAYDDAQTKIDALVKASGGYVDSTRVSHSEGRVSSAQIVLRVPATGFAELLPKLRALGEVLDESTDSSDITAQYVDMSARLTAAQALEKRLLELAADRTGTVADVLEVERELARVRGEIEQYQGQMRLWDNQVSLSTLTISLSTRAPALAAPSAPGLGHDARGMFDRSLGALGHAGRALLLALIALLPWMPLIVPGFLIGRRYIRRWSAALPKAIAYPYPMPMPVPPQAPAPTPAPAEPSS